MRVTCNECSHIFKSESQIKNVVCPECKSNKSFSIREDILPPGPPNPPICKHGKAFNPIRSNCHECAMENKKIKGLVYPLIDNYWECRGKDDLYYIVFRAYHMGMRNEHNN